MDDEKGLDLLQVTIRFPKLVNNYYCKLLHKKK